MENREALIKKTIESITDRKYRIIESKENLIVNFKPTEDEEDNKLREKLEKEFIQFHPRLIFVNFF